MIRKKLWSILNHLNLEYKASGTRLSNFFDFCAGHHEIYYMRKHLESKTDLVTSVVADLPDKVFMESSENFT